MGFRDDLERFRELGEERREDLTEFIQHGDLGASREDLAKIPIKIVNLPEFAYSVADKGGVGQGGGDVGDPVGPPQPAQPADGDGDGEGDDGEPGDGEGEHGYYEMDPEEFAEELDEELGLDLEPKGKKVIEETEGAFTDTSRQGPMSMLDVETFFKRALKRKTAMYFDEEFMRDVLRVSGIGPESAYEWARANRILVSRSWLHREYEQLSNAEKTMYESIDDIGREPRRNPGPSDMKTLPFRHEDKRYRYPEIIQEKEKNVVVVNIRDVSGSMREKKRELVERTFTPLDWYLTGKYESAEFVYIAHDREAWEVEREDFFGIKSGGGTRVSSAYALAKHILDERYPWSEWNRYVFAAGDGENGSGDTTENVIPLIENIPANLHGYVNVMGGTYAGGKPVGQYLENHFGENNGTVDYPVTSVQIDGPDDVTDAIYSILNSEDN